MSLPLEGIRVLDLSRFFAGPFCTQLLADFGAEVIKIEDPKTGDPMRLVPPLIAEQNGVFYSVNRNKKSISLDLRKAEGQEVFKKLVQDCDVVLDLFRPGVMEKMGLGYDELSTINKRLIYCSLNGYGSNGPMRDAASHDINLLSMAGITGLTGNKGEKPAMSAAQIAGAAGGSLYAVIAILMAVISREKSGRGQYCDISMMDGALSLMTYSLGEYSGWQRRPERGNELMTGGYACYNIYQTRDGEYVSLGAIEGKFWANFCEKIDKEEFVSMQWDPEKQDEMKIAIQNRMLDRDRDDWVKILGGNNSCFTSVLNLDELWDSPQVQARNMLLKLANFKDSGKDMFLTGNPVNLSQTPARIETSCPEKGENNQEILSAAGYSQEEIVRLKKEKII